MDLEHCLHWLHLEPTHLHPIPRGPLVVAGVEGYRARANAAALAGVALRGFIHFPTDFHGRQQGVAAPAWR
jgi:hypothetical protein